MKHISRFLVLSALVLAMLSSTAVALAAPGDPDGSPGPGWPGDGQGYGVGGEVTAVDGDTISVENPFGEATIRVTDETKISVNGEAGSLADIQVGMFVLATGEVDEDGILTATRLFASNEAPQHPGDGQGSPLDPGVGGEVTAVAGDTVSVENPYGEATIRVTDETKIVVNGEAGSLADIQVGMFVLAMGEADENSTIVATRLFASDGAPRHPEGPGQPGPGEPPKPLGRARL